MKRATAFVVLLLAATARSKTAEEWKSRVIYQLLTDRFSQGEVDSDEDCVDLKSFCGGTYRGVISKLDYLQDLGVDAIWISPIVANIELGYHGYWAEDIYGLNPEFGTEEDLLEMVEECHRRDVWVMVDVVPNHMGNQDTCTQENDCPDPYNFSQFTPFNETEHYHEFCSIEDLDDQQEVEDCRLYLLPDLRQENPVVSDLLLEWIADLTAKYDFDGYRVDTARHVPQSFLRAFGEAAGAYLVGEVSVEEEKTEYCADYQNVMDGVLNFPFYFSLRRVFGEGFPMTYFKENLDLQRASFPDASLDAPFVDNHDQPRFLALNPNLAMLRSALSAAFFAEGIPILYYGTEQAFDGDSDPVNRESLWPHFDQDSEMFIFVKTILEARKSILENIIDSPVVDIYVDDSTYAFSRGDGPDVIVAVSNAYDNDDFSGYSVTATLEAPPAGGGAAYYNVLDPTQADVVFVDSTRVDIDFQDGLEPKVYVKLA